MFERFTEQGRRTLFFARYETTQVGGLAIEAEHMLLGLLRADRGLTPHVFAAANFSYADARVKIQSHLGAREQGRTSLEIPFSAPAKRIMHYAEEEADRLRHRHIGDEHLLLGVLREESSFAAEMLRSHGMTIERLREEITNSSAVLESHVPPDASERLVRVDPGDPIAAVERIRLLSEELGRLYPDAETARGLIDEINHHLDALKRHWV